MGWRSKRVVRSVVSLVIVVHLTFLGTQLLPGGPAQFLRKKLREDQATPTNSEGMTGFQSDEQALVDAYLNYQPNAPPGERYVQWISNVLSGDFGRSILYDEPVAAVLGSALPWTVFLFSIVVFVTFALAVVLGALMAYNEGSRFDNVLSGYLIVSNSIPYYVLAIMLVFYLALMFPIFPDRGKYASSVTPGFTVPFVKSVLWHAALPVLSMTIPYLGGLEMRANAVKELESKYVNYAKMRGVKTNRIVMNYVARNSVLPVYMEFMAGMAAIFGGSVIVEQIFVYRGVGWYLYKATLANDWPLLMGGFVMLSTVTIAGITLAELTYGYIDPRASEAGQAERY